MPELTANAALPYPSNTDVPDMNYWNGQLAEKIDDELVDTGWQPFTGYASGWTLVGSGWRARRIGRIVYVKGNVQNATHTGTSAVMAQWPAGVTLPPGGLTVPIISNTPTVRQLVVNSSGGCTVYASGTTNAYYGLDGHSAPCVD